MSAWDQMAQSIATTIKRAAASLGEAAASDLNEYGTRIGELTVEALKRGSMEDLNILRDTARVLLERNRVRLTRKTHTIVKAVVDGLLDVAKSQIGVFGLLLSESITPPSPPPPSIPKKKEPAP